MGSWATGRIRQRARKQGGKWLMAVFRLLLMIALTFVVIYPVLQKLSASFMSLPDVHDLSVRYIPKAPTLDNYAMAWEQMGLSTVYPTTIGMVLAVSVLQVLSATMIGYGLARFRTRVSKLYFGVVILSIVLPPDLLLIPLFNQFRHFDILGLVRLFNGGQPWSLVNTPWPFVILGITGTGFRCGIYILLMRQFFRGMPKELEEAAYIDGAGPIRAFVQIMLPGSRTMMLTIGLFSFVWLWLDTSFIPILMPDYGVLVTVAEKLTLYSHAQETNKLMMGLVNNAGVMLLILPLLILYCFTQKYFVQSVERSGLVG